MPNVSDVATWLEVPVHDIVSLGIHVIAFSIQIIK